MMLVEVRSRVVGVDDEIPTVVVEVVHEQISVTQLIRRTVEAQIRELERNYQLDRERTLRALRRQYLTEPDLREQSGRGKIKLPSAMPSEFQPLDVQQETAKAADAFRSKAFLILVDGKQIDQLDEMVSLRPSSKIVFVRLTPLVGG